MWYGHTHRYSSSSARRQRTNTHKRQPVCSFTARHTCTSDSRSSTTIPVPLHLVLQRPVLPSRDPGWPDWKNLHKLVQSFNDMSDVPEGFGKTIPILHGNHHLGGVTPPGQKRMTVYHIEIWWDMFDNVRLCADVRHTLAWSCRTDTIKIKEILQTTKNSTRNCRKNVKIHYTLYIQFFIFSLFTL